MRGKARTVVLLFSVGVWPGQLDGLPVWLGESTKFQRRIRRRRRVAGMENRREQLLLLLHTRQRRDAELWGMLSVVHRRCTSLPDVVAAAAAAP